jgi:hypothetical protein
MESFEPLQQFLPQVWFFILGLFLFLYVLLDGFDLGVGILSLTASSETRRSILMTSLGNVWDANETWLVLMGGSLFGAFPLAYATILNALYIPLVIMVVGLILRAVSFEFRENANNKLVWNLAFGVGSFLAALGQGFALGSVFEGIRVDEAGHFAGSPLGLADLAHGVGGSYPDPGVCFDRLCLLDCENHGGNPENLLQDGHHRHVDNFAGGSVYYHQHPHYVGAGALPAFLAASFLCLCCNPPFGAFVGGSVAAQLAPPRGK